MRYRKKPAPNPAPVIAHEWLLGQLFVVTVRMVRIDSGEIVRHKLLMVGCESSDIERKLRWVFDCTQYKEFTVKDVEKVREKVHILNTTVEQPAEQIGPVIQVGERSQVVAQQQTLIEQYKPKLYAIGIVTTMLGSDEQHALRKVGRAIIDHATTDVSTAGAHLSEDSTISVEEVPLSSGFAKPRNVEHEANRAHIFRN